MSITRVKVYAGRLPGNFYRLSEKDKKRIKEENLEFLKKRFRRACQEYGIASKYKEHSRYEKPSDKKRRIKRQRELQLLKDKRRNKE